MMNVIVRVSIVATLTVGCGSESKTKTESHDSPRSEVTADIEPAPVGAAHAEDDRGFGLSSLESISYSILRNYHAAANAQRSGYISYPICVMANFPITDAKRASYRATMEAVVNRWNRALIGQPGWNVAYVSLYLVGTSTFCPDYFGSHRVYKIKGDGSRSRGYAEYGSFLNVAGGNEFWAESYMRELHEYGHQIGMGDTYTEVGYQQPYNQTPGVMNNFYLVNDLTPDDLDSVRHIWRRVYTGTLATCPADYYVSGAAENVNRTNFCVQRPRRLTSYFLGAGKCLDIRNDWLQSTVEMSNCGPYSGQHWKVTSTEYYEYKRLKTQFTGEDKCLEVTPNGYNVRMLPCNNYSGQFWLLEPWYGSGYVRFRNLWQANKCLDIVNDGIYRDVRVTECGAYSGQLWTTGFQY